jgi:hypothetical protein
LFCGQLDVDLPARGRRPTAHHHRHQPGHRREVGNQPAGAGTRPPYRDDVLILARTGQVSSWSSSAARACGSLAVACRRRSRWRVPDTLLASRPVNPDPPLPMSRIKERLLRAWLAGKRLTGLSFPRRFPTCSFPTFRTAGADAPQREQLAQPNQRPPRPRHRLETASRRQRRGHFGKAGLDRGHRLVFQRGRDEVARPEDVQRQLDNLGLAAGRLEVWEDEATEFLQATVDAADADGRLRGILDAVRSNRVEDDFSGHWSHAHEDFERKLYRKRSTARSALTSIQHREPPSVSNRRCWIRADTTGPDRPLTCGNCPLVHDHPDLRGHQPDPAHGHGPPAPQVVMVGADLRFLGIWLVADGSFG